jgi:site-specific recombinase XerD
LANDRAGITDFKRHDLRHDAATNMVESGANLIEVRDILGHSDIRMTQRYAHAKEQGVHQAVARLAERAKKLSQICPKRRKAGQATCLK